MSKNKEQALKAIEDLLIEPDQVIYGNAVDDQGSLYPEVKIGLEIALKLLKENKMTIKVNKLLKIILPVLENYHKDLEYWRASDDVRSINYVTSGTPEFKTIDQFESYFNTVKKITRQVKETQE